LIVVDASLFAAWLLGEPDHGPTHAVWDIVSGETMFVPVHWPNEVANALRRAVRTKRLTADQIAPIAEQVSRFSVDFAEATPPEQIGSLALDALDHGLSTYDMIYVRIARDHQYPLATIDRAIREAARRLSVQLLPERMP
jgi:predicted nucleic acid-binding protein